MDINASIAWAPLLRTVTPSACSQGIGDTSRVLLIILPICRLASLASLMTCQEKRKTVPVLLFNGKYDECVYTRLCQAMLKQHCAGSCETPTTSCFTSSMRRRSSATSAHARGLKGTQPVMRRTERCCPRVELGPRRMWLWHLLGLERLFGMLRPVRYDSAPAQG